MKIKLLRIMLRIICLVFILFHVVLTKNLLTPFYNGCYVQTCDLALGEIIGHSVFILYSMWTILTLFLMLMLNFTYLMKYFGVYPIMRGATLVYMTIGYFYYYSITKYTASVIGIMLFDHILLYFILFRPVNLYMAPLSHEKDIKRE